MSCDADGRQYKFDSVNMKLYKKNSVKKKFVILFGFVCLFSMTSEYFAVFFVAINAILSLILQRICRVAAVRFLSSCSMANTRKLNLRVKHSIETHSTKLVHRP